MLKELKATNEGGLNIKELIKLLDLVSPNRPKEIVLHWFTKGYGARLGTVRFSKWPFDITEKQFTEQHDAVFFIEHVNGGTLIGWTNDTGRYMDTNESDASKCKRCGRCCRGIRLHVDDKVIETLEEFKALVQEEAEYSRFTPYAGSSPLTFTCSRLLPNGSCSDHENRMMICRMYPHNVTTVKKWCGFYESKERHKK